MGWMVFIVRYQYKYQLSRQALLLLRLFRSLVQLNGTMPMLHKTITSTSSA
jgi:hypothetical protein